MKEAGVPREYHGIRVEADQLRAVVVHTYVEKNDVGSILLDLISYKICVLIRIVRKHRSG